MVMVEIVIVLCGFLGGLWWWWYGVIWGVFR